MKRTVTYDVTTQFSSSSCVLYSCKPSEILPHKGGVDSTKALRKGEMESSPWITIRTWKNCRNLISTAFRQTIFRTWYLLKLEFLRGCSMLQSKNRGKPAEPSKPPHSRGRTILQGLDRLLTFQETDRNDSVYVHRPAMSCLDHANKAHRLLRCFHPLREILACTEELSQGKRSTLCKSMQTCTILSEINDPKWSNITTEGLTSCCLSGRGTSVENGLQTDSQKIHVKNGARLRAQTCVWLCNNVCNYY